MCSVSSELNHYCFELSCTPTHRRTDTQTDGHEYSIVDKEYEITVEIWKCMQTYCNSIGHEVGLHKFTCNSNLLVSFRSNPVA